MRGISFKSLSMYSRSSACCAMMASLMTCTLSASPASSGSSMESLSPRIPIVITFSNGLLRRIPSFQNSVIASLFDTKLQVLSVPYR